ncbi:antibiotic biosynthesis monooxygenase [Variovorax dokdonensis]|uniref:Antibiotic biosynthesis monooxygenase n=1 Tax=Variovorax dokdonensis TaxID=344883 RepID=A0ABT7N5N8_9BURK|nr:antibiotic biosynthesis monooxygenase [Variovorax dokdonensis]MDM0043254.1 antibiotic biosynthesis monooxygenase [Variovorax dokdonensis]
MSPILRTWTFWIHSELREECRLHLEATKLPELRAQPGNTRAAAVFRDLDDGTTEVVVMSVWDDMASIKAFTGQEPLAPTIDPNDRPKLFDHEPQVRHYLMHSPDSVPAELLRGLGL